VPKRGSTGATTSVTARSAAHPTARAATHPTTHVTPHYYAQQQPTPDRYREIQQALADKGYFHGSVDGEWGADSTDALKRFQMDQNLDVDGKIGALSLIGLGLGPRRESASARPALAPSESAPSSAAPGSAGSPTDEPATQAPIALP
jgi:peptidoglycan hydrolase-like protein with peptidoglycan-binding domain